MNVASSPIFLNSAGNVRSAMTDGIRLLYNIQLPIIPSISGTDVVVKSTLGGVEREEAYDTLFNTSLMLAADANTPVYITGNVTRLFLNYRDLLIIDNTSLLKVRCANTALTNLYCTGCTSLSELNLSANTALTELDCTGCTSLSELNLSANTALTNLYCQLLYGIETIKIIAENEDVATAIAGAITGADSTTGTVYVASDATYYQTISDAATAKGWTVEAPAA